MHKGEAGDYARASLDRLHTVAALLQVHLDGQAHLLARGALQAIPSATRWAVAALMDAAPVHGPRAHERAAARDHDQYRLLA